MRLILRTALVSASSAAAAVLAFSVQLVLARALSVAEFSVIASAISGVTVLGALSHWGIGQRILRLCPGDPKAAAARLSGGFVLALLTVFVASLVLGFYGSANTENASTVRLVLLPMALTIATVELAVNYLAVARQFRKMSILIISSNALRASAVVITYLFDGGLNAYSFAICGASILAWLLALLLSEFDLVSVRSISLTSLPGIASDALPYGLMAATYLAFTQGGAALLGVVGRLDIAGSYALTQAILAAVYIVPVALFQRVTADEVNLWRNHDLDLLRQHIVTMLPKALLIGIGSALALASVTEFIALLFGKGYEGIAGALRIACLAIPLRCLITMFAMPLNTREDVWKRMLLQGAAATCVALFIISNPSAFNLGDLLAVFCVCELFVLAGNLVLVWSTIFRYSRLGGATK